MRNLFFLFLIMLVSACAKEKGCTNVHSTNYNPDAEIDNGDCRFLWDPFIGLWQVRDECPVKGLHIYQVNISKTEDIERARVTISGLYVEQSRFTAIIEGTSIRISAPEIEAFGTLNVFNEIVMDYNWFPFGDPCSSVWSKIE